MLAVTECSQQQERKSMLWEAETSPRSRIRKVAGSIECRSSDSRLRLLTDVVHAVEGTVCQREHFRVNFLF